MCLKMSLFRRFFYRRPPDGLLEICERVYVFDSCFSTDVLEDETYQIYMRKIAAHLHEQFRDSSILVFNFREGERKSQLTDILSQYDMTVMDYPRQYESCPLLSLEMTHHFLRSSDSWLSLEGHQNIMLMHCERGGWPVLAFILSAFLIYRKFYTGEQRTLDMVYREAPKGLLQLLSPLNPTPSQVRYLQYVARRTNTPEWPPPDRDLFLDCLILRVVPSFDAVGGCRPLVRIYGRDLQKKDIRATRLLFSPGKKKEMVRHYRQVDCDVVKVDVQCSVQGDVVLECIHLETASDREEMMFRVMFNTAFIRSNILMLGRDDIDTLWNAKELFTKDFRAEVLFSDMHNFTPLIAPAAILDAEESAGLPMEVFARVRELFNSGPQDNGHGDAALRYLQQQIGCDVQDKHEILLGNMGSLPCLPRNVTRGRREEGQDHDSLRLSSLRSLWPAKTSPLASSACSSALIPSPPGSGRQAASVPPPVVPRGVHDTGQPRAPPAPPPPPSRLTSSAVPLYQVPSFHERALNSPPPRFGSASKETVSVPRQPVNMSSEGPVPASGEPAQRPTLIPVGGTVLPSNPSTPSPPCSGRQVASILPLIVSRRINENERSRAPPAPPPPASRLTSSAVPLSKASLPGQALETPPPSTLASKSNVPVSGQAVNVFSDSSLPASGGLAPSPPPDPVGETVLLCIPSKGQPPPLPPLLPVAKPGLTGSYPPAQVNTGVGKPPPPPPPPGGRKGSSTPVVPPSPMGITRAQSQSLILSNTSPSPLVRSRKATLKPLHWVKVTQAVQGSLWEESQKQEFGTKGPEIDMNELENLFSNAVLPPPVGEKKRGAFRSASISKQEKTHLIDLRRANNCEIMLTKIKMPMQDLLNAVLNLDASALDVDQIENLIKFSPTKEEMDMLKEFSGDKETLGKAERFFLELMKVPRVEAKLRVFAFKTGFTNQVAELRSSLLTVNEASREVRESGKLRRVMQTILSLGNALNQGTARGSAVGFKLDSLLKLTDTRARNNKMTLMHYLCKVVGEKLAELLDFPKDLAHLEGASRIQLKMMAEEMQDVSKGLEKVEQELTLSEYDGHVSHSFCKVLKAFLNTAEADVRSLASLYSEAGRSADSLSKYFGEDPARCPFEQVTSILLNFIVSFNGALEDNAKQGEQERKMAEKVAEKEKLRKFPALRDSDGTSPHTF